MLTISKGHTANSRCYIRCWCYKCQVPHNITYRRLDEGLLCAGADDLELMEPSDLGINIVTFQGNDVSFFTEQMASLWLLQLLPAKHNFLLSYYLIIVAKRWRSHGWFITQRGYSFRIMLVVEYPSLYFCSCIITMHCSYEDDWTCWCSAHSNEDACWRTITKTMLIHVGDLITCTSKENMSCMQEWRLHQQARDSR
jgi:hypothetical protein